MPELTGKTGAGLVLIGVAVLALKLGLATQEQAQGLFAAGATTLVAGLAHKQVRRRRRTAREENGDGL